MNGACSLAHKPVSRQPCTGMHRDCDLNGSNGDRQKKGAGSTETKKGDEAVAASAPSGWLKIDSSVLQKSTEASKSSEVNNKLEDDFVEEDVDIEAEVKKSVAGMAAPNPEITNLAQIPSEPT